LPDGRLVPQGNQVDGRHEGPEVPRRRLRRPDPDAARRGAAADRRRRHLSGPREGHDRRLRMGRSVRRREARLQQGRQVLLLPGWWEGASVGSLYINNDAWAKLPSSTRRWSRRPPAS
jgi:hypothetical protein